MREFQKLVSLSCFQRENFLLDFFVTQKRYILLQFLGRMVDK